MEVIAFFVWPAVAFGILAYLGWSSLPKKSKLRRAAEDAEALRQAQAEFRELESRIVAIESLLEENDARAKIITQRSRPQALRKSRPEVRAVLAARRLHEMGI